jgi:membrane protease YdiL (CAAX protease family)
MGLLLALSPPRPAAGVPWPAALVAGGGVGLVVYLLAVRRLPRLSPPVRPFSALLARHGVLGLWALNEEIIWRRVVLGELLASGALVALSLSTVGFALAHRARALHLGTGAAFGGLYLSTGALVASVVAHWVYNVLVRSSIDRGLSQSGTVP